MDTIFKELKKAIDKLNSNLDAEMEEVRKGKEEIQQLKVDMINSKEAGQYIRDEKRIVISAPEIIIGNVDATGTLWANGSYSAVTIRANHVGVDGVAPTTFGDGGSIVCRAASIKNLAVDPGIDGKEEVVMTRSEVLTQAKDIVLDSRNDEGVFAMPVTGNGGGVTIHADKSINIDSSNSIEIASDTISDLITALKDKKNDLKDAVKDKKKKVDDALDALDTLLGSEDSYASDIDSARANLVVLDDIQTAVQSCSSVASRALAECLDLMADLAETNRQIRCLDDQKTALSSAKGAYKDTTEASVAINSERILMTTNDGDGVARTNAWSGIDMTAPNISMRSRLIDGTLIPDSTLTLAAQNVNISTADIKLKEKGKYENADNPAIGTVTVTSKTINMETVDYETKDSKPEEKDLTKGGIITMRAETLSAAAYDKQGKATGQLSLNAKDVQIKSLNMKREEGKPPTDDKMAEGGTMLITAEKVIAGSKSKDNKTKTFQVAAETVGTFAEKTAEMQQGDGKAVLTLDGGNATIGGSKTDVFGTTTLNNKTEVKDELKAPKVTVEHVEAKTSFKSPNISDGVPVPPPPSTAKVSAKLKQE